MAFLPPPLRPVLLVYTALGVALWPVPLLNRLHVESSAVIATVAFFAAGLSSLRWFRTNPRADPLSFSRVWLWQEAVLLVPLLLLTVAMLWAPNCGYAQGLLFFVLFPVVTVGLAVAIAYMLAGLRGRRTRLWFVLLGIALVVLGPIYDLGLHPQFYTYNHVFGGVLGPIYDEALVLRPGLFVFRGLTVLWAVLAYLVGHRLHAPWATRLSLLPLVAVAIGGCYLGSGWLGINTPDWKIQQTLGGLYQTPHFDIYYDPASLPEDELQWMAEDHEYQYARLAALLNVTVEPRIRSYLYPDADTKGRLTGARATNVAPVWLRHPQTHVLLDAYADVFPHELAHAVSREFGLPVIRASRAVGLVEGLAVALEPPDGRPSPDDLVTVGYQLGTGIDADLPGQIASQLSPFGFWTGRGAVSYTTMGSFVRYLLDTYGAEPLKQSYATADFDDAYGKPVETLALEWMNRLHATSALDLSAEAVVQRRFTVPSLLERDCPHYVPPYVRTYQRGLRDLAAEDSARALQAFTASLDQQPAFFAALNGWAQLTLAQGDAAAVHARLDTLAGAPLPAALLLRLADAHALLHQPERALRYYQATLQQLPPYTRDARALVVLRKALASDPSAVRTLTRSLLPQHQAARLDTVATPAAAWMQALRLAEAGRYEQAAAILRTTALVPNLLPSETALLQRQRLTWLAGWLHRAGFPAVAERYALQAAQLAEQAGDRSGRAYTRAFADKMYWIQHHTIREAPPLY